MNANVNMALGNSRWTPAMKGVAWLAAAIVLIGLPLVVPGYLTFQLSGVMAYAVAAIGLNLITGYVGLISLGHNAFFALGAYTAALSIVYFNVHYITSVFLAAIVSFVVGYLAGFPAQRLRGLYLALITLVLAVSVAPVIKHFKDVTGGMPGMVLERPTPAEWTGLTRDAWIYYMVLMFAVICFYLAKNFVAGSTGRALTAIRLAPLAASSMGVNVNGYKVLIFGLGSMMAGIGGALFNFSLGFVGPDSYTLMLSVSFLAAVVVGGIGTIWGALIAGMFLQFVPTYASEISEALAGAVYGGILIACMFFMPKGIAGTWIERRQQRLKAKD